MAIYRLGQKIKELFISGASIAKVYDHGNLVFSKEQEIVQYTFSINPSPSDALVSITRADTGVTTTSKTITVPSGTTLTWEVSKTGYATQTGSIVLTSNVVQSVTLVKDETAATLWCYHYYGKIPGQISDKDKAHLYFYLPPNTTSGKHVFGAGQKLNGKCYDIACTKKGTSASTVASSTLYSFFFGSAYTIKTASDSSAKIYPSSVSSSGAGVITGSRDTSGDLY